MDARRVGRVIAVGRVAFGALCLAAPRQTLGRAAREAPGQMVWMTRAFGIRDIVLGSGALVSLASERPDPTWVTMGAVADTADAVTAVLFRKELGGSALAATLGLALPAAAAGWRASNGLRG